MCLLRSNGFGPRTSKNETARRLLLGPCQPPVLQDSFEQVLIISIVQFFFFLSVFFSLRHSRRWLLFVVVACCLLLSFVISWMEAKMNDLTCLFFFYLFLLALVCQWHLECCKIAGTEFLNHVDYILYYAAAIIKFVILFL